MLGGNNPFKFRAVKSHQHKETDVFAMDCSTATTERMKIFQDLTKADARQIITDSWALRRESAPDLTETKENNRHCLHIVADVLERRTLLFSFLHGGRDRLDVRDLASVI